jgi:hypothetical protein
MGLTKPRAAQIFNLDYKQSTRVVTTTNITLTGGAPNSVDGINLSLNDRVLVTGQTTGSQNGLYLVTTLGSGANGTWARTSDGNENGEIEAGMIVMVTEGTIYADTQWKLITDDPIVINTTALTFTQNYMANSISGGTSNVVVNSNANVTVSSAGTANVLTVSNTGAFVSGVTSASGNVTGGNLITAGLITATGNITGGNITTAGLITATGTVTGGNLLTAGIMSSTGNGIHGNILTGGLISATGNVTGNYILGNGALLTGVITSSSNINNGTSNVTVVSSGGNVTVGISGTSNVATFTTAGLVANSVAATNNGAGTNFKVGDDTWLGDINLADTLSIRGQQNAANAYIVFGNASNVQLGRAGSGPLTYGGAFSAAGNVTGGNILTVGQVSATGNVTGNFFVGNGAFLTGLSAGTSNGISNGATSISIPVASGNIAMSVAGQSNTVVINLGSLTMYGTFAGPKTLAANVAVANAVNAVLFGPVTVSDGFNITVPDASTLYTYSGA